MNVIKESSEKSENFYTNLTLRNHFEKLYDACMKVEDLHLAENLKRLRTQKNMSQYELSKRSKVTTASISRIESGLQINVQLDKLVAICNALDCSIFDLLTDHKVSDLLVHIREYLKK